MEEGRRQGRKDRDELQAAGARKKSQHGKEGGGTGREWRRMEEKEAAHVGEKERRRREARAA